MLICSKCGKVIANVDQKTIRYGLCSACPVKQPKDFEVNHHKPMVYRPFQYLGIRTEYRYLPFSIR